MKKMIAVIIFTLAGSLAFGQIGSAVDSTAQVLPQPATILLCTFCGGLMSLFKKR